jgi:hypothetical protein
VRTLVAVIVVPLLLLLVTAGPALAQTDGTVQIERSSPVLERPRGDSFVLGSVQQGDTVRILGQQGGWYLIAPPSNRTDAASWQRGWIRADAVNPADRPALPDAADRVPRPPGRTMLRAFGQFGGVLFTARDSFEAILDGAFGPIYGGGGQIVFPNGGFIQAGFERFTKQGTRVVVSGDQLYVLPFPTDVSVTPVLVTFGYRPVPRGRLAPYLGAGFGIHRYEEESPSLPALDSISTNHFGFHLVGGAEVPLLPWVALAGEAQWAGVPKALGDSGVSLVFDETDLGGTTFRVKIIVGR